MIYVTYLIDGSGEILDQTMTTKDVWKLQNRKVIVHFDEETGQPDDDSAGLFGSWLGQLSTDVGLLPIDYTDWRVYPNHRKEAAWNLIKVSMSMRMYIHLNSGIILSLVLALLSLKCRKKSALMTQRKEGNMR